MRSTSEGVGNAAQILLATAATHGDRVAVTVGELSVDYDQLAARSLAFARALADAHIRPGDRVAVLLRRGADAAAAFFGVLARSGRRDGERDPFARARSSTSYVIRRPRR